MIRKGHMTEELTETGYRLTRVYDWLEGEVAALCVEGEFVNVHPAGADQDLVILNTDCTVMGDGEMRTWRSFVLFCPDDEQKHIIHSKQFTVQ